MNVAAVAKPRREGQARAVRPTALAVGYGLGAAACVAAGAVMGGWGWAFCWSGVSLALVSCAYAVGAVGLFGKRRGRLPVWSYVAYGPYLLGQRVSWWVQSRGRTACSELLPGLWIGRRPGRWDCEELNKRGVTATLDLTAEISEAAARRGDRYFNLPVLDLTLPDLATLRRAVAMVEEASRGGGGVYVHCALGYGRTATVAAACLLARGEAKNVDEAMARVRECRPGSVFSAEAVELLRRFAGELRA